MRKFLLLFLTLTLLTPPKSKKKEKVTEKKKSKYDELFASKHSQADGFITIHKIKDKVYFELPLSLLQRDMLLGSTITEISDNSNAIIGSKPTTPIHFCFERLHNKICMSIIQTNNISTDKDAKLQKAIALSNINIVWQAFDIAAYNNDSTAVVFEVSKFFTGDNKLVDPFEQFKYAERTSTNNEPSERQIFHRGIQSLQ